jgi:PAS domain S-box-containing protein
MSPLENLRTRLDAVLKGSSPERSTEAPQEDINAFLQSVNGMADDLVAELSRIQGSERKFREIYHSTNEAIFTHDMATGEILEVNDTMLEMYGYTRQELQGLTVADVSSDEPPYTQKEAGEMIARAVAEGMHRFEWRARRKGGGLFWVDVTLKVTEIGGERRILAMVSDVQARREYEKALVREKKFSQAVIDAIPGIFYVYNEAGELVRWNKIFEELSGHPPEDLKGREVGRNFKGKDKERLLEAFYDVFRKGEATLEIETEAGGGKKYHMFYSAKKLETDEGLFQVGIGLDFTDKKRAETNMRQAQKMEAIGTLAGGIAHDFNNILAAIIGYTDLAKMDALRDSRLLRYLNETHTAATRATELVKQILTFGRQVEKEKHPLQVSLVVREAVKLLKSSIPATIQIRQDIRSEAVVLADPTQIHQIVMNLCTNAYHAMQEGGGTMEVTLADVSLEKSEVRHNETQSGPFVEFCVSDTGRGIEKEVLPRIFDPYFTTKEPGRGTGLGLSIVQAIIEDHGGFVRVESEPGQGTTFKVFLPVTSMEAADIAVSEEEPLRGGSERIMFVDDDRTITEFARDALCRYGYEVECYTNGVQALQSMEENSSRVNLLVTDMTMPYMTGMVLASRILAIRPDLPIILSSGNNESMIREREVKTGIAAFLQKPYAAEGLIRIVRDTLDRES